MRGQAASALSCTLQLFDIILTQPELEPGGVAMETVSWCCRFNSLQTMALMLRAARVC